MVDTVYLDEATTPLGTNIELTAGTATGEDFNGGNVLITSGSALPTGAGSAGNVIIGPGTTSEGGDGGSVTVNGGDGGLSSGAGGGISLVAGNSPGQGGGALHFTTGNGAALNSGGDIVLQYGSGGVRNGLFFPTLPIADPEVDGAMWNDAGTVKISAGPPP